MLDAMTTTTVTELLEEIRKMSPEERAEILRQIDLMEVQAQNDAWEPNEEELVEIRRRVKAIEEGEKTYSWEEVRAEMHALRLARSA